MTVTSVQKRRLQMDCLIKKLWPHRIILTRIYIFSFPLMLCCTFPTLFAVKNASHHPP